MSPWFHFLGTGWTFQGVWPLAEVGEPGQDLSRLLSLQVLSVGKQMFTAGILPGAGGGGTLTMGVGSMGSRPSSWKLPLLEQGAAGCV